MEKFSQGIKILLATLGGVITHRLGGWDVMLEMLVVLSVLDILTGVILAVAQHQLSSDAAWRGFAKKLGIYIMVAVSVALDNLLGTTSLRGVAIGFFIGVEGISIIENWGNFGLPMPQKLRDVLKQLSDKE